MDQQQPGQAGIATVDGQTNGGHIGSVNGDHAGVQHGTPSRSDKQLDLNPGNISTEDVSVPVPLASASLQPPPFASTSQSSQPTNTGPSQEAASSTTPVLGSSSQPPVDPNTPRQAPHPDAPLPPALQAQFYARFRIQPPQTHGQLQQFLRQAAQAQAAFQARSANMAAARPGDVPAGSEPGSTTSSTNPNPNPSSSGNPLPATNANHHSSSGPGTPQSGLVEQGVNGSVGVPPAPSEQAQKSGTPNTPNLAVDPVGTPRSGNLSFQPGPSGSVEQTAGQTTQGQETTPGAPSESELTRLSSSDVSSFRPRQLSGSDRGEIHAALASVGKSPAGSGLALGVGPGGGAGPHFDGLGRLPAGMDIDAIRKQMQALRESQNRRSSASSQHHPMIGMSPGYNRTSNPLGQAGMGSSAIANSPLDTAGASGSSPAVVPDVNIEKSGIDQGPPEVGPGPSGMENGSNGLENRRVSQQGGPENAPGTPSSASNTGGSQHPHQQRRPTNPNQAAFAAHFLNSLKQFVSSRNINVPPNLFDNEPADPEVPGSTPTQPGVIDVLGKKVDLFRLYFTVIQMGGYAKVATIGGWAKLAAAWGFPPFLPSPWTMLPGSSQASNQQPQLTRTTTIPGEMLINIYETLLLGFEEQSRIGQAAQAAKMQQQQGQTPQGQAPQLPPTSEAIVPTAKSMPTEDRDPSRSKQPENSGDLAKGDLASTADVLPIQPVTSNAVAPEPTLKLEEPAPLPSQSPANNPQAGPSSRPTSRAGSTLSQIGPGSSSTSNRPEGEMLAHRQRMLLQAQTKAMLQGVPSPSLSVRSGQEGGPSSTGQYDSLQGNLAGHDGAMNGSDRSVGHDASTAKRKLADIPVPREKTPEPLPKRVRYKIEYRPLSRMVDAHGGWDIEAVALAHRDNALAREALVVEDLGRVDIEALSMSIRSRIPSEISYALTVLGMLSMPGKGEDKGGLGLGHCGDLLDDLVDLVEEETFGEDGWQEWAERLDAVPAPGRVEIRKTSHTDLLVSAQFEAYSCQDSLQNSSSRRVEVVLLVISLLRNFSLMADNYTIMTQHARFVEIMIRVCDPRLTLPVSSAPTGLEGPASFGKADHLRIREDVLDIFHGLSFSLNLTVLPLDAVGLMVELALSHLKGSQTGSISDRLFRGPADHLDMPDKAILSLEVLTQTSCSDQNRRVLRRLEGDVILEGFVTCLKYLAFDEKDAKMLMHYPPMLDVQVKLAFCLYNFAFVASLPIRARLRETVGVLSVLGTSIHLLSRAPPLHPYAVMVRCLSETIGVLNGPDDLMGERRQLTFGPAASARGLKGWNDAQDVMEQGILAAYEDRLLVDFLAVGRAAGQLDRATFEALSRSVWAL